MNIVVLIWLALSLVLVQGDKCYALVLAGGGFRGAYESGALLAMTEFMDPEEVQYRIVSGISIGAMNSCFGVGYSVGEEREMALHIQEAWNSIKSSRDMYSFWFGFALFHGGLVNTEKLLKFIQKWSGNEIKRNITATATDLNNGDYTSFDQTIGIDNLTRACYASGAYPPFFPPVELMGNWYGDGAMVANANPFDAINTCRSYGYDDPDIVVDIVYCIPLGGLNKAKVQTTRQTIDRINLVQEYFSDNWYTETMVELYDRIDFRLFIIPKKDYGALGGSPEDIKEMMDDGYNEAKEQILAGREAWKSRRNEKIKGKRFWNNEYD